MTTLRYLSQSDEATNTRWCYFCTFGVYF